MALLDQANSALNSGRESLLDSLGRAPEATGLQSIFWVIALAMVAVIILNFRKGGEERKSIIGPAAVLLLSLSVIFGFNILLIAWIVMFALSLAVFSKIKKGEWKGVLAMVAVLYVIAYVVSADVIMMVFIAGAVTAMGIISKNANHKRTYGTSEAAKIMKRQGYPVKKERRIIRRLARIAGKGYSWSKDKIVRSSDKLKQRFARREVTNIEEQEHEAEMVAAGKEIAETIDQLEKNELQKEQEDGNIIMSILRYCEHLKRFLASLSPETLDSKRHGYILSVSKTVLRMANKLAQNKIEEERYRERAGKVLDTAMDVMKTSAKEAKQLEESKAAFKEIRRAVDQDIATIKKKIDANLKGVLRAEARMQRSKTEGAHQRLKLLEQRQSVLENVEKQLGEIDGYVRKIIKRLTRINLAEDKRINQMKSIIGKADHHRKKLGEFAKKFEHEDKQLRAEQKKFAHLFKEEGTDIPDGQLVTLTESTLKMMTQLKILSDLAQTYNKEELQPLIQEMAAVVHDLADLSRVSEYITKMYFRFSQGTEKLTELAAQAESTEKAKKKLAAIAKTEQFEQKITRRAYRKGRMIMSHIRDGYKSLVEANGYVNRHIASLDRYGKTVESVQKEINQALNNAFDVTLHQEIKEAKSMEKGTAQAETDFARTKRVEQRARRAA